MIKENKKNKLITFICACLMVCASALGLVNAFGTTLASSPTAYNVTTSTFNYKSENFLNQFDYYCSNISNYLSFMQSGTTNVTLYNLDGTLASIRLSDGAVGGGELPGKSFVYGLLNGQVVSSGMGAIVSSNQQQFIFGNSTLSPNINNGNIGSFDLLILNVFDDTTGLNYLICNERALVYNQIYLDALNNIDTSQIYNNGYNTGYAEGQTNGYNSGVTVGQNNVINNPNNYDLYTQAQYEQNYINGQNSVINNPNAFGLYTLAQYNDNYTAGYFAGQQDGYENGYVDGEDAGIDIGYQLGLTSSTAYDEGKQFVIDNPSLFNLYTEADMEQRYLEGFNDGLRTSREGILYNSNVKGGIVYNDNGTIRALNISQYIINSNGVYTLSNGFYNAYNDILSNYTIDYVTFSIDGEQISVDTFKALGFIMTDKTLVNVITNTGIDRTTTFNVTYSVYDDIDVINDYNVVYRIIPVIENNLIVNYEIDYDIPTELLNKRVASIDFQFADNLGNIPLSLLTNFSLSDINNLAYNAGYDNGYNDAMNSSIVNNAYDKGYTDGNRVGYQQGLSNGLANSNDYTFFGLIGAVIDAPIQYLSSLFNFEILGFNLLSFITSLFTVCVIIWIVKMLLGGK